MSRANRGFDLLGATCGLLVFAPVMGIVAAAVRLAVGCLATFVHRHPVMFAHQWASLDVISGGREIVVSDPTFVGLTGPLEQVIDVAEPLAIHVEEGQRLPSGGYEVDHTAAVVGIADGEARMVWTQGVTPPDLAQDVEKLLEEKA